MKKNILSRLLAVSLTMALLLPCLTFANANTSGWAIELWKWTCPSGVSDIYKHINMFNSNVLNESGTRSRSFSIYNSNVYTENGPTPMSSFSFWTGSRYLNGKWDGLPAVTVGSYVAVAETLEFELGSIESMYTTGLHAMNVNMIFSASESEITGVVPFNRRMEIYVSLDGETWLEDSVGIRSTKLLGGGPYTNGTGSCVYYEIQSENLFDIEGFNPGNVVRGIKILPEGKFGSHDSTTEIGNITVNGYETRQDWEAAVPAENRPTVTIDPDILRQIVVDEGVRTASIPWTTDTTINVTSPTGSSSAATEYTIRAYVPGIQYRGPIYNRNVDGTREQLAASIVNGKFTSGFGNDTAIGMDCQTFGYNMISRVARTNACYCTNMVTAAGLYMLGNLKTSDAIPRYTDKQIIDLNTEQAVYEAYALAKGGDVLDHVMSNSSNSVHVRPIRDVVVVRNADGSVNGDESYMICVESTPPIMYKIRHANGDIFTLAADDPEKLYAHLAANPGSEVLYGSTTPTDTKASFAQLRNDKYVAFSPYEYIDGVVELADVEIILAPKKTNTPIEKAGLHLTVASNYRIIDRTIKLEDLSTGEVLFEDFDMPTAQPNSIHFNYENEGLDKMMAGLTNGSYRLSATVSSGPLTAIGQTKVPSTTKTYDFTVTGKDPAASISLSAPKSVSKGNNVQVLVSSNAAFDGADVEIKFDTEQLTFVDGALSPANAFGYVTADKGMISIMAVEAGASGAAQLAALNFTAKKDIANVSDAVQVKSAQLITADAATTGVSHKAVNGSEACASINFTDVAQNAWYHDAVDYALNNSIMGGYNATTFGPNDTLTRAMVVQVLYNKEGQPAINGSHTFPDVKSGDWFNNAVTWASINKVVGGYGDGRFGPNDNVTLEQIAVILWNYSGNPTPTGDASSLGTHSDWAANALSWAAAKGIFQNVPYNTVTGTATRAQTAQMLMNYLSK